MSIRALTSISLSLLVVLIYTNMSCTKCGLLFMHEVCFLSSSFVQMLEIVVSIHGQTSADWLLSIPFVGRWRKVRSNLVVGPKRFGLPLAER